MPLHLLGKKSWNVYNQDNIDRVQRDEAEARAAQQESEQRRKDNAAAERLRLLRGEEPGSKEPDPLSRREHKRKKGSEDALFELQHDERASKHSRRTTNAEVERTSRSSNLNEANITQEPLDQISNMRFRDAAGRNSQGRQPWYSNAISKDTAPEIGRDVWGNEDAGRQARDQKRLNASDPLLAMKRGVKQLKDSEQFRSEWRKEREKDLHEVEDLARRERHRKRREEKDKSRRDKYRSRSRRDSNGRRKKHDTHSSREERTR